MGKILVSGHRNPDTDSIMSAIVYAHYLNEKGQEAEAVALGNPSEETQFALDHFGFSAPRLIDGVEEGALLALVDHNEAQQSVPGREKAQIISVIDHHRIANFETADPVDYRAERVGCTNTILYKLYKENNVTIPEKIAGLMLSAVISDTLLMKSPTCTDDDIKALKDLANIAKTDLQTYGLDLLKAGTNLSAKTERELLDMDAKSFPMGGSQVRIGQVNTVDISEVLARKDSLEALMEADCQKENYDVFVFLVTDILESNSLVLAVGDKKAILEDAFGGKLINNTMTLDGVVSRKKQVVPPLTKSFEK